MSYASRSGRARTSASNPNAFAVCDRCGIWHNWINLQWQYDWRGASLQNIRFLVCRSCLDTPQEQLRAIVVPADPLPIIQARVEPFVQDETNYQTITQLPVTDPITGIPIPGTTTLVTQDGQNLLTQPIGPPVGLEQGAVMPLDQTVHYGVNLDPLSVVSDGVSIVTVTCRGTHGLADDDQVSVEGLTSREATGFYSVTVLSATTFTYMTNRPVAAGGLLISTTNIITVLVGLPYDFTQIPQTGI